MDKLILDLPVGKTIQKLRKRKGYTQMDVVRKANLYGSNMSESTYSKIEQGKRNLFVSDFVILKLILDFTYEDIFGDFEASLKNQEM